MSDENEHTLHDAANLLGWAATTLRDKCTKQAVPHHRRHAATGIYFTDEDIAEIKAQRRRRPASTRTECQPAPGTASGSCADGAMEAALAALTPSTRTRRAGQGSDADTEA